jgi:hypothetical protein
MKRLRPFLLPAACFATAWAITFLVSRHSKTDPPEPPLNTRSSVSNARCSHDAPRKITGEKLAQDFRTRPMSEWPKLWEEFATQATAKDLQTLPLLPRAGRSLFPSPGEELLQRLGREELAIRAGQPVALSPESFSALAEIDPEAAWKNLEQYNKNDFATAALRTLAQWDPAGTLRRFQAMPVGSSGSGDEGRRASVWNTPLGSIFGAWARKNPSAAAAAVMDLPPADRIEAANHVAMTWAFRDGPAAIRFVLGFDPIGQHFESRHIRLDVMLRASFRTHPAETAKLMAENAVLRKAIGEAPCLYVALNQWSEADPESVVAWLLEPPGGSGNRIDSLGYALRCEPQTAARIIRGLAAAGSTEGHRFVEDIYRRDPELALSLADELGIALQDDPDFQRARFFDEPEAACDRWLQALREHGDPDEALAELGWTKEMATHLASRAARVFPGKAAELAKLIPASWLDPANLWRRNNTHLVQFWPELEPYLQYPESRPSDAAEKAFPESDFRLDPATAAEAMLAGPISAVDAARAMELWAPCDPEAARAWLARLPEGEARDAGELAFAKSRAAFDPLPMLDLLTRSNDRDSTTRNLWSTCLRRLVVTGGDWRSWLDRMPLKNKYERRHLADSLAGEERLLEKLRGK